MLKIVKTMLLANLVLSGVSTQACDPQGKTGFMPKNDMFIPAGSKSAGGINVEEFSEVIDSIEEIYAPVVAKRGATLVFHKEWNSGRVNAYTRQTKKQWHVHMLGGLARHHLVDRDAFSLVACHELGHHLGGGPRKPGLWIFKTWATNEGQADYWASSKCFRRLYADDDNASIMANRNVAPEVVVKCENNWDTANEQALCQRSSMAAAKLATLLNGGRSVSFTRKDSSVVDKTYHGHPAGQCRLDTYFAGALCIKDVTDETKKWSKRRGNCNRRDDFTDSVRPLCWFKP